jgi:transposase
MLPKDFPPMSSVRYYFDKWNRDGTFIKINDTLRKLARQALNRDPEPSISVLDSQSTTTTEAGGERGFDGEKSSADASDNAELIRTVSWRRARAFR